MMIGPHRRVMVVCPRDDMRNSPEAVMAADHRGHHIQIEKMGGFGSLPNRLRVIGIPRPTYASVGVRGHVSGEEGVGGLHRRLECKV